MKKFLSCILAVAMCLALMPTISFAATDDETSVNIQELEYDHVIDSQTAVRTMFILSRGSKIIT